MTRGQRLAERAFSELGRGFFSARCGVCDPAYETTVELLMARHLDSAAHRAAETAALEAVARQEHGKALEAIARGLAHSQAGELSPELVYRARVVISKIDGFVLDGLS